MPALDRELLRRLMVFVAAGLLVLASGTASGQPPDVDRTDTGSYTSAGLEYTYRTFVPATLAEAPALLVMIHGCKTTAAQQQRANLLDPIARRAGFLVLYVDGSPLHQLQERCWSGLLSPATESRTSGDAAAIAGMTRLAADRYHVDANRVYALGMSSGAFETALLGAYFPDLFAAVGVHSGGGFGHGLPGCFGVYFPTEGTEKLAAQAFSVQGEYRRVVPMIDFHGDADTAVPYECGQQAVEQSRLTNNMTIAAQGLSGEIPANPVRSREGLAEASDGYAYTVRTWEAPARACPVMQAWTIHGMAHYWSGGSAEPDLAEFTDPRGPNASELAWEFFSRIERTRDGYTCRPTA